MVVTKHVHVQYAWKIMWPMKILASCRVYTNFIVNALARGLGNPIRVRFVKVLCNVVDQMFVINSQRKISLRQKIDLTRQ